MPKFDDLLFGPFRHRQTRRKALTGHLVFSTLHTNDAASAVTRLLELGIEPFLVSSSVIGVLAQRLVRRICDKCKTITGATQLETNEEGGSSVSFVGSGCSDCRQTGFRGRLGLFELMTINESIRSLIHQRANAAEIRETAQSVGMKLLRSDGIEKVARGVTTESEVLRVSQADD